MPETGSKGTTALRAGGEPAPFSDVLRFFRTRAGMSQESLATAASLGVKTVASLEQGLRRAPYQRTVGAIANALGLLDDDTAMLVHSANAARQSTRRKPMQSRRAAGGTMLTPSTSSISRPEVLEIANLMRSVRLLTVTGSGGVGKTRTAIEAVNLIGTETTPTYFIELAEFRSSDAVLHAILSALRIQSADALSDRELLIVLDGCEHITGIVADIVRTLLRRTTGISVLVTSREPLSLSTETVFRLPPLTFPNTSVALERPAESFPAVALFLSRAGLGESATALPADRLAMIVDICRRLDGVPLALELAASHVTTLGLDLLHDRLEQSLSLPGPRDMPARHRTMLATILWSFESLDISEQRLLQRLAIFQGGFTLRSVQSVCVDARQSIDEVINLFFQLVDKSMVEIVQRAATTRFALLDVVRIFALDRLSQSGESATIGVRHAQWMADEADRVHASPLSLGESATRGNIGNARAAVGYGLELGTEAGAVLAARILRGYRRVWFAVGDRAEHSALIDACLRTLDPVKQPELAADLRRTGFRV